ncbi:MAG: hypothetical protein HYY16_16200 [Planctomycetes bacterium]|nr:hypothetical protein [Planctomycetota bacterium]
MLHALRAIFIAMCGALGVGIGLEIYKSGWIGLTAGVLIGFCCVLLELAFARRFIAVISTLMFGIVVGFIAAYFMIHVLVVVVPATDPRA